MVKKLIRTVGNILQRHGTASAPARQRTTTGADFIRAHLSVLAGTGFFSAQGLTQRGFFTYGVVFFIHLENRRVEIAGITPHPIEVWMERIARNVTLDEWGLLKNRRYLVMTAIPNTAGHFAISSNLVQRYCCRNLCTGAANWI